MATTQKPRSENRVKTKLVQVRATPEEKAALKARADAFGISMGELCRQAIFGMKAKSNVDQQAIKELADARADLGRLGGLLKGWLGGAAFPDAPGRPSDKIHIEDFIKRISVAENVVLDRVKKIMDSKP